MELIVTGAPTRYLSTMAGRRLIQLLSILALLFGAIGMAPGHAAMQTQAEVAAMPHAQSELAAAHCDQMEMVGEMGEDSTPQSMNDCMATCALLVGFHRAQSHSPKISSLDPVPSAVVAYSGVGAEHEPPPPRSL